MSEVRLKRGLFKEVEEKRQEEQRQKELREKHDIEDGVVVVEKTNGIKFTIRLLIGMIKTVMAICMIGLCAVGIISLIYPNIRIEFLTVIGKILQEAREMI